MIMDAGKWTLIFDSIRDRDDTALIQSFLETGLDVNALNMEGMTMLSYASKCGKLDIVRFLVQQGADYNLKNVDGSTPLTIAARFSQPNIVSLLIESGAHLENTDFKNKSLLHYVSKYGYLDSVKYLLQKGHDINATSQFGETPLILAIRNINFSVVKYLLDSGADFNICNAKMMTPLHIACSVSSLEIVKALVEKGSDINNSSGGGCDQCTPLHMAAQILPYLPGEIRYNLEIIKYLLQNGANSYKRNTGGATAFKYFLTFIGRFEESACLEFISLFLEKGGAYFEHENYYLILRKYPFLHEGVLKNSKLCTLAIMNKVNADLFKIYEMPGFSDRLPPFEHMKIANNSNTVQDIEQSVRYEIQKKGFCRLLMIRPVNLAVLSIGSLVKYSK